MTAALTFRTPIALLLGMLALAGCSGRRVPPQNSWLMDVVRRVS
jgi:hypothetical protein